MKVDIFITMSSTQEIELEEGKSLEQMVRDQIHLPDEIMEVMEDYSWNTDELTVFENYEE